LQEFYQIAFRKKLYESLDALQADLDDWAASRQYRTPSSGQDAVRQNTHRNHERRERNPAGKVRELNLT